MKYYILLKFIYIELGLITYQHKLRDCRKWYMININPVFQKLICSIEIQ